MGIIYADIELINAEDLALQRQGYITKESIRRTNVKALVDTGAYMLCVNESIKAQLGLPKIEDISVEFADNSVKSMEKIGPIKVIFKNRKVITSAIVLPGDSEILLGSIPLEEMDVIIDTKAQNIDINPKSPYLPRVKVK